MPHAFKYTPKLIACRNCHSLGVDLFCSVACASERYSIVVMELEQCQTALHVCSAAFRDLTQAAIADAARSAKGTAVSNG